MVRFWLESSGRPSSPNLPGCIATLPKLFQQHLITQFLVLESLSLLLSPLLLELGRGEIAQRRMGTLVHVHVIEKATQLTVGIIILKVL
jgi:hypothetical protein